MKIRSEENDLRVARPNLSQRRLHIGIINIMPQADTYERLIREALIQTYYPLDMVWIRLETHAYRSTPADHLAAHYVTFDRALSGKLDGLILTGAPVETFSFSTITYWPELKAILEYARSEIAGTLGICWGGIALGKMMGIDEEVYPKKLFGVFRAETTRLDRPMGAGAAGLFDCPQSRFAGVLEQSLNEAVEAGEARTLCRSQAIRPFIFESTDRRYLSHLGHPEYQPERLVQEWHRDSASGRTDVPVPVNFDVNRPENTWTDHSHIFFSEWLHHLDQQVADQADMSGSVREVHK